MLRTSKGNCDLQVLHLRKIFYVSKTGSEQVVKIQRLCKKSRAFALKKKQIVLCHFTCYSLFSMVMSTEYILKFQQVIQQHTTYQFYRTLIENTKKITNVCICNFIFLYKLIYEVYFTKLAIK